MSTTTINGSAYPPLKTLDGKTIEVGTAYLSFNPHAKPRVTSLLCVSVNLRGRYWIAQRADGSECRIRVSHVTQYGRHNIYANMASIHAEERRIITAEIASLQRRIADSDGYRRENERAIARLRKKLAAAKGGR